MPMVILKARRVQGKRGVARRPFDRLVDSRAVVVQDTRCGWPFDARDRIDEIASEDHEVPVSVL